MTFDHYILRPPEVTDAEGLLHLISNEKERLIDYFPVTARFINDLISSQAFIMEKISQAEMKSLFTFLIIDTVSSLPIGVIFIKNIDWAVPKAELSYFIDQSHEGKGVITKGIALVVSHCIDTLGMNRLFLRAAKDNIGSQRVAIKNGFRLEGTLRNDFKRSDGTLIDLNQYSLLKADV